MMRNNVKSIFDVKLKVKEPLIVEKSLEIVKMNYQFNDLVRKFINNEVGFVLYNSVAKGIDSSYKLQS